jgi:ATP-dependent RNA helicase DDX55/SPB4
MKATTNNETDEKYIVIEMLHGKMVQKRREKTMERFRMPCESQSGIDNDGNDNNNDDNKHTNGIVLFCTDVAARGLDVSDIQWVVQMDAPQDPSFFIHRVGRCARANKIGQSLLFVTPKEESYIDFLHMRNIPIEPLPHTERCCPPSSLSQPHVVAQAKSSTETNETIGTGNQRHRLIYGSAEYDAVPNHVEVIDDLLPKIYHLATTDRDILEKGTKAYTSYIRAYKEHHCAFIFRYVPNFYLFV